jgi:hypothetical protein
MYLQACSGLGYDDSGCLLGGCDSYPKCVNDDYHWGCVHESAGDFDCQGYPFQPDCYCWYIRDCTGSTPYCTASSPVGCVECTNDQHCKDAGITCENPSDPERNFPNRYAGCDLDEESSHYLTCYVCDACIDPGDCEQGYCCQSASAGGPGGVQCVDEGPDPDNRAYICVISSPAQWIECDSSNVGKVVDKNGEKYVCMNEAQEYVWSLSSEKESQDIFQDIMNFLTKLVSYM